MKEEILAFLKWLECSRAVSLFKDNSFDEPYALWNSEIEDLVNEFTKSQEEK